jgi:hypothetical protein
VVILRIGKQLVTLIIIIPTIISLILVLGSEPVPAENEIGADSSKEIFSDFSESRQNITTPLNMTYMQHEDVVSVDLVINFAAFLIVIALILCLLFVYMKYKGNYTVEEIFLIYENGNLISHKSNKSVEDDDKDDEVISSMFTAVQDFIKDSFEIDSVLVKAQTGTEKNEWQLNEMEMENHKIIIEHGSSAYLAVIYTGKPGWKLKQLIKLSMNEIEVQYTEVLRDWNGNMEKLKGVEYLIQPLVEC